MKNNNLVYELVNQFGDVVKNATNPKEISDMLSDSNVNPYKNTVMVYYNNGEFKDMVKAMKFLTLKF